MEYTFIPDELKQVVKVIWQKAASPHTRTQYSL